MLHAPLAMAPAAVDPVHPVGPAPEPAAATVELLLAVLDSAEHGVVVADAAGRALYMNASARAMAGSLHGVMPGWLAAALPGLRQQVARHGQAAEQVVRDELTLRLKARALARPGTILIELNVAAGAIGRPVAEQLARGLGLAITDAKLLALLWRGLSNEEIAQALSVRTGTIKSRLFRLYQRLGVKKRPAAVLRAQATLAS